MDVYYKLSFILVSSLCVAGALTTRRISQKGDLLNEIIDILRGYQNQQSLKSTGYVPSKVVEAKGKVCSENEEEAERQTVHIDGHNEKPDDLCINKKQKEDDERDRRPPQVYGIRKVAAHEKRNFGISRNPLWKNNIIPYDIDTKSFGPRLSKAVDIIQKTAYNISQTTCVKWRLKTNEDKYFIKFIGYKYKDDGCWSYVGNQSYEGGQELLLSEECLD
ncbi:uncharacterized protein LOC134253883, partial [Saccostrea cucullata]|uniref:uncharacterized protein LOC134253883 n=1 Tax=Saccostrea cuccullata TaxID=36930 RepID=UPI002ED0DA63